MDGGEDDIAEVVGDQHVLNVSELNERLSDLIDDASELQEAVYTGEIIDIHETDTALYFELADEECAISCVLWRWRYEQLEISIEDGAEVLIHGELDFCPEGGKVSIHPHEISVIGDGDRGSRLKELEEELRERGLFDQTHKQALPEFSTTVGVATSRDGDARYDIESSIIDQYPGVNIVLQHTTVQGSDAPEHIVEAVEALDNHDAVDVIIVGRGGGSSADLMAFNTEVVAEAIFKTNTPTIVAVGHTEDRTFAGMVADHQAITPSAAGSRAVPNKEDYVQKLDKYRTEISTAYSDNVHSELSLLQNRLQESYRASVKDEVLSLETDLEVAAETSTSQKLRQLDSDLESAYRRLEQERELESEVREAQRITVRRYKIAVLILIVLLIAMVLLWVIT